MKTSSVKSSAIYQGLFLLMFGLYAHERIHHGDSQEKWVRDSKNAEHEVGSLSVREVQQEINLIPAFQANLPGFRVLMLNEKSVVVEIESDEFFREGRVEVEPVWHSTLDQFGSRVFSRLNEGASISIEVSGPLGRDRAAWIQEYLENHFQSTRPKKVRSGAWESQGVLPRIRWVISF